MAGASVFDTRHMAKVQNIASVESGRRDGALDLLLGHLIDAELVGRPVFDSGTSINPDTGDLNEGNCAFGLLCTHDCLRRPYSREGEHRCLWQTLT